MERMYEDAFIETRMGFIDNLYEIDVKREIDDTDIFREEISKIKQEVKDYNFRFIIFVIDKIKYLPDENLIRSEFLQELNNMRVKKIAIVVGENKDIESFHREFINSLESFEDNIYLKIMIFSDIDNARKWIELKSYPQTGKLLNFIVVN
jgi:hypothetical protein